MDKKLRDLTREDFLEIYSDHRDCVENIHDKETLKAFFEGRIPALLLKEIMVKVGEPENSIPQRKKDRITWVINNVRIEGIAEPREVGAADANVYEEVSPEAPTRDPMSAGSNIRTIDNVQRFINGLSDERLQPVADPAITRLKIHAGFPVEYKDNFMVRKDPGISDEIVAVLHGSKPTVNAVGRLQSDGDKYHIILDRDNIDFKAFEHNKKHRIALFPTDAAANLMLRERLEEQDGANFEGNISIVPCTIDYSPPVQTNNVLCIDYGTSNTCVGSYGLRDASENNVELVSFTDTTSPDSKESFLYPTLVCVADCSDAGNIRYLFGYDARRFLTERNYDTEASVFFEIKRWTGTLDTYIEIQDEDGNSSQVKRGDIVRAYLNHVIDMAQQDFKVSFNRLHLSAPVKLKTQFHKEVANLLPNFTILDQEDSADEGFAIIYSRVSDLLRKRYIEDNAKSSIMILDCGGGTTDLANCEVRSKTLGSGQKLEITTKFVNGDSNFGGNNITFRILQLLKIKLAAQFAPDLMGDCDLLKDLIPQSESTILSIVEDESYDGRRDDAADAHLKIYERFDEAYQRAEKIIPTIYRDNPSFLFEEDRRKIRRNYYYLWQLAENVKIKFYEDEVVSVDFRPMGNRPLNFDRMGDYFIYVSEDGKTLRMEKDPANAVEITINEIRRVLCGDIYSLLNKLLEPLGENKDKYQFYKLTGQSCQINLFMELLKEFIPGRKLRTVKPQDQAKLDSEGSLQLKLDCIEGCVEYVRDREGGKIQPEIYMDRPELIYDVWARKADQTQKIISHDHKEPIRLVTLPVTANRMELLVENVDGKRERTIGVDLGPGSRKKQGTLKEFADFARRQSFADEEELDALISDIDASDPYKISEEYSVYFVFALPARDGYGMNIYRLMKSKLDDGYAYEWWEDTPYECYENESSEVFFSGTR